MMFTRGMSRVALTVALAAIVVAASAVPASAAPQPALVKLVKCSVAEHEAVFRGRMTRVDGAARMWMRFTLLERTGSAGFKPVRAPGLGVWRKSKPGVEVFGYRQAVQGLPLNAVHRMRIDFRWLDEERIVLQQFQRHSPSCRQFEALPNLTVTVVGSDATKVKGVTRYRVRVGNPGKAAVANAHVAFRVDGALVDEVTVPSLGAGWQRTVSFRGPDCGRSVSAQADPAEAIVESSEADNLHELACADIASR